MPVNHAWDIYEDNTSGLATAVCSCGFTANGPIDVVNHAVMNHL